eukprot:11665502-Alexandrium_andersonii.AAC.1
MLEFRIAKIATARIRNALRSCRCSESSATHRTSGVIQSSTSTAWFVPGSRAPPGENDNGVQGK